MKVKILVGEHKGKIGITTSGSCDLNNNCFYNVTLTDSFGKEFRVTLTAAQVELLISDF